MSCVRVWAAQKVGRARASLGLGLQSVTLPTVLLNKMQINKNTVVKKFSTFYGT